MNSTIWLYSGFTLVIVLAAGLCLVLYRKSRRLLEELRRMKIHLEKTVPITMPAGMPATASFNKEFQIPVKTDIPVKMPVQAVIQVPLKDSISVTADEVLEIAFEKPLLLDEEVHIISELPLKTRIETIVMGVKTKLPVRGIIPVDIKFRLKQPITIRDRVSVRLTKPLNVTLNNDVLAPVDFTVEGVLPLDHDLTIPLESDVDCRVTMPENLPVNIKLDVGLDDLKALKLRKAGAPEMSGEEKTVEKGESSEE